MAPNVVTRVVIQEHPGRNRLLRGVPACPTACTCDGQALDAKLTVVHVAPPKAQTPIPMEPLHSNGLAEEARRKVWRGWKVSRRCPCFRTRWC